MKKAAHFNLCSIVFKTKQSNKKKSLSANNRNRNKKVIYKLTFMYSFENGMKKYNIIRNCYYIICLVVPVLCENHQLFVEYMNLGVIHCL